jgi:hypothetical protein
MANSRIALRRGIGSDDPAVQRPVFGEAADDRLNVAGVESGRIAHEQIVDGEPILDRCHV